MPCVGNDAFATLPSYSVNLVCHLPFKEVEAYVTLTAVLNKIGIRGKNPKVILHLHSQGVRNEDSIGTLAKGTFPPFVPYIRA